MSNQVDENKITCRKVGDYMIPNITIAPEERNVEIGLWGQRRKDYLKNHRDVIFNLLLMKGTLNQHLAEVDKQAEELFFRLIDDMAKAEMVTEQLKAEDQMEWVGRMNNIKARAREIVNELVYV